MRATEARKKRRWRSYYGAEQKSLHVKMYFDVLENLDKESAVDGTPRNALINQACEYYIKQLDEERSDAALGRAQECTPNSSLPNQVTAQLDAGAMKNLEFIAKGMGCTLEIAAEVLLDRAVTEYFRRPFSCL
ncbi:MAG: hypothetical protein UHO69_03950 [Prevotella sp.]|nr:hypothetical protein [Prevotella sp.]